VTIRAHTGESVTLTGGIGLEGPAYVIFDGFRMTNAGIWVGSTFSDGSSAGHHIRFLNIDAGPIDDGNVVQINRWGHHVEFIGGAFHDASYNTPGCLAGGGGDSCYAFYITGSDNLIERVKVFSNPSYGIHFYSGYPQKPNRNVVRYSEIYNNGSTTAHANHGILLGSGDDNRVYDNLIYNNGRDGIASSNGATNSKIYNNTVYGNNTTGLGYGGIIWGSGSGTVIKNNIVYNNKLADFADSNGSQTPTFSNNLCTNSGTGCARAGNPLFFDQSNYNYNLQPGSPAIDSGTTLSDIPASDIKGTPRPQAASWDIGAYEYR
jgi:parallel beta-helix repeat protein